MRPRPTRSTSPTGDIDLVGDMTAAQFAPLEGNADIFVRAAATTGRRFGEITFDPGAKKDGGRSATATRPCAT